MGAVLIFLLLLGLGGGRPEDEDEDEDDGDGTGPFEKALLPIPSGEPDVDWQPRPVQPVNDAKWLADIDALVSLTPKKGRFYKIETGVTAAAIAHALLVGDQDFGANRVRLIKCLNRGWNLNLYGSTGGQQTWGDLYDDDQGRNLSAAFLPRHASAVQSMANRHYPERNISGEGAKLDGPGGHYGLLWIPEFTATANALVCPSDVNPPAWLLDALESA